MNLNPDAPGKAFPVLWNESKHSQSFDINAIVADIATVVQQTHTLSSGLRPMQAAALGLAPVMHVISAPWPSRGMCCFPLSGFDVLLTCTHNLPWAAGRREMCAGALGTQISSAA